MPSVRTRGERVPEAAAFAAVGGFLDAYMFLAHGGVFANAQTGNVVLFGVEAGLGHWSSAWGGVPPILAFVVGMVTVELLARSQTRLGLHRPTRVVLVVEMVVFAAVAFLPSSVPDVVSTVLVAWAATLQVGTFRKTGTVAYNTTFTTGNIRSLVSEAAAWLCEHDRGAGTRAKALLSVVVAFAAGAVLGGLATDVLDAVAIVLTVPALALLLVETVFHTRRISRPAAPN